MRLSLIHRRDNRRGRSPGFSRNDCRLIVGSRGVRRFDHRKRRNVPLRGRLRVSDLTQRKLDRFHRQARSMRDLRSALDDVPGIGPRRRRALLTRFGSLAGVRRATREELETVVGSRAAGAVIDYFARSG